MSSKLQVFLMLPVLFMGTASTLYHPLTKLAYAVVLLIGRVMSERFRRDKGYVCVWRWVMYAYQCITCWFIPHASNRYRTCFNHIFQGDLKVAKLKITEGLSEFAQATPPSSHKSHLHQMVHYPRCVDLLGSLSGQWMFGDERRNKVHSLQLHVEFNALI